jgi:integrase
VAIQTGARQGEILGLKWSDFDWESKQVHIQRSFSKGEMFTTKTKGSIRKIDLGPSLIRELKKWKIACPANDQDLVFPNENGNPMNYTNMVNRHFFTALVDAKIAKKLQNGKIEGRIRFHDLRHTYASLMIELGFNLKYIQTVSLGIPLQPSH